jgi:hypothetical protein
MLLHCHKKLKSWREFRVSINIGSNILLSGVLIMDQWTFGLTMTLVGVTGTFITMASLILSMNVLKRIFPLKHVEQSNIADKKA